MTTPAQRKANQRNAQKSTGPKTAEGKAIAARNATRHGLLAQSLVLDTEDAHLFADRRDAMRAHLAPVGEMEEVLVERIVTCAWRLRRLEHIEASVLRYQVLDHEAHCAQAVADGLTASPFGEPQRTVTDTSGYTAARRRAEEAEAARDQETLAVAYTNAFIKSDALVKLSRYEVAIERSLFRSLHELQRLQAVRMGNVVSAPAVVDVEVSTSAP